MIPGAPLTSIKKKRYKLQVTLHPSESQVTLNIDKYFNPKKKKHRTGSSLSRSTFSVTYHLRNLVNVSDIYVG